MNKLLWILIPLLLIQTMIVFESPLVSWDEAVYIGMGKDIYSAGESGLYESFRPVMLPLLVGQFWKLGLDPIFFGRLLVLALSLGSLFIFYRICNYYINDRESLLATLLLGTTSIYFISSTKILTGIVAVFFILLAYYYHLKENNNLFGLFMGFAFVTRYPAALFFVILMD